MDIYLFAFCLMPVAALIGTLIIIAIERRDDRRHPPQPRP